MSERGVSTGVTRSRVSTGYEVLDGALQGGFILGSSVVLSAPASDEVPHLIRRFLTVAMHTNEPRLLICRTLAAHSSGYVGDENVKFLVCGESVPPAKNILPGKSIDNLTELNIQISEALKTVAPKRIALDIVSDILLRHKVLQTRKWLGDFLGKLRAQGVTTLAVMNPFMHAREEVEGILDLFDGAIEIVEVANENERQKILRVKWMHGVDVAQKEVPLIALLPEATVAESTVAPQVSGFKEPQWLTPLVNRVEEVAKLKDAFQNSLASRSSLIALEGEAGVGKTRLIRELAALAKSNGAVVLVGRASKEQLPYGPWVEIAREYIAQLPGESLRKMLGAHVSEFGRLVPDIAAKLGTIPPSRPLDERLDRIRLYDAFAQFLIAISKQAPLVLVLEDMQWVDQGSLSLLEYFARSSGNQRVFVVCCYRSEEVDPKNPLYHALMNLNRERLVETISVRNFDREETRCLVAQVFGEERVSTEFADLIYQRTRGNPFFVEEILRNLVEDGTVYRTERGWDRKPIQDLSIPESVKASLRSRLTKLQQDVITSLTWAAVVGLEFDFDLLRAASGVEEEVLLERMEKALSAGLVTEIPHQKGAFRFVDSRVRELLLGDLSGIRRSKYHLKVGEAAEKLYGGSLDRKVELLAHHFAEGGDVERGIKYSIMAGDKNAKLHAYDLAITNYRRALDLIDLEGGRESEKGEVLQKLAAAYDYVGKFEDCYRVYDQARAICEKLDDRKACAHICVMWASAIVRGKGFVGISKAIELGREGLKYLEEDPESAEAASIYGELAGWHGMIDEWDEAVKWAEKASVIGEKTHNFAAVAGGLMIKGSYLTDTGRIDEGLPLWERAFQIASQHGEYRQAVFAARNISAYRYPRSLSKALEWTDRHRALAEEQNDIIEKTNSAVYISMYEWLRGDWGLARKYSEEAFEIMLRLGESVDPSFKGWLATRKGHYALGLGDLEAAEASAQQSLTSPDLEKKITVAVEVHLLAGMLRLEQGRRNEAQEHFERCVNAFRKWEFTTLPLLHVEVLKNLTAIYAEQGNDVKALEMCQWARRIAEQIKSDAGLALAWQAEAELHRAKAETKQASESYSKSIELWERAGWPYYMAKALAEYSQIIATTFPQESRQRLEEAREVFRKLGAKRDLEKAEAKA